MITKLYKSIDNNSEYCFYILHDICRNLDQWKLIYKLLGTNRDVPIVQGIEIGPRSNMVTPWCTNVLTIFKKIGIHSIKRVEFSIVSFTHMNYDKMTHCIYNNELFEPCQTASNVYAVKNISKFNKKYRLGFDKNDVEYYVQYFKELNRFPTNVELYDIGQSNSEHCRHTTFNANLVVDGEPFEQSMMQMVKSTLPPGTNSLVAFSDNSSAIKGKTIKYFYSQGVEYFTSEELFHPILTAETHNFPTGISPFPGANTGVGGRIRDVQAMGRGGIPISGAAGYCVGDISKNIKNVLRYPHATPRNILIEASNGASDYGNKFGEPIIQGFCRTYASQEYEWIKPIMFTSGVGLVHNNHLYKESLSSGDFIVKIGGPAYRIGLGGGTSSSNDKITKEDFNAVQRGDPEMEQKMNRVVKQCIELFDKNPIKSIHDQGAGGNGNVLKELVYPCGGIVDINRFEKGDPTMSPLEVWCSEYQEQNGLVVAEKDFPLLEKIAKRENVNVDHVGYINNTGRMQVVHNSNFIVDLPLDPLMKNRKKTLILETTKRDLQPMKEYHFREQYVGNVLSHPSVGSKAFLTNKVDRSVTGLIAQQQCVGPLQLPLSNVGVTAHSFFGTIGTATAIGERPIFSLIDVKKMVRLTIAEMLTNMMWAKVSKLEDIKCAGNWMWPAKQEGGDLAVAVKELSKCLIELGVSIDGGKDSLSMSAVTDRGVVKSPPSLVLTGYVTCDILHTITPDLKKVGSTVVYLPLTQQYRLGGSVFAQSMSDLGDDCPDVEMRNLKKLFNFVQENHHHILSGHDVSDGGLLTTLAEMSISGCIGMELDVKDINHKVLNVLFSEEPGIVIEVKDTKFLHDADFYILGKTTRSRFIIKDILNYEIRELRKIWEKPSYDIEIDQIGERLAYAQDVNSAYLCFSMASFDPLPVVERKYSVAILREEGSNGDREMAAAFYVAGFNVADVTMNDIISGNVHLRNFNGIVFTGGFTFSDALGAGKGWSSVIENTLKKEFDHFYHRSDTFSLGVCNGCQVMSQLGWVKGEFIENDSGRFESRYLAVNVKRDTKCFFFKNLTGLTLPIWVAHKEGKYIGLKNNICMKYNGSVYPLNPNGSQHNVAAICSDNGRHLAMMPHPERCFLPWQLAYNPEKWKTSPWLRFFHNAYLWCNNKIEFGV